MTDPSLAGLIHSYTRKTKEPEGLKLPKLKGNINPNRLALKGLIIRKGPRSHRVRIKV